MIRKTYMYQGQEREAWFRELSVADTMKLMKDQKVSVGEDGKPIVQLDIGKEYERSLLLVTLTLCDEHGTLVYGGGKQITKEPSSLVAILIKLAKEAEQEHGDGVGN